MKTLVVEFDATSLTRGQQARLAMEALVQADVAATTCVVTRGAQEILITEYDVTELSKAQIEVLTFEVSAQGEASDDGEDDAHPEAPVVMTKVVTL